MSTDDEDAELVTPQVDIAILRTLARIKKRDPLVYEDGRQIFDGQLLPKSSSSVFTYLSFVSTEEEKRSSETTSARTNIQSKSSKARPVLLKDYQRARLLADPTGASLDDESSTQDFTPTFAQEERDLKEEVKKAFGVDDENDDEEEEDLLVPRTKTREEREKEDQEYEAFLKKNVGDRDIEDALEADEQFLRGFVFSSWPLVVT